MAPKTSEQYEVIREARMQQIMGTALQLFAAEGFANTSISKIAGKAKISKGLMYNYFKSKDDLLQAIYEQGFREMFDIFDLNKDGVLTRDEFTYFIEETFNLMNEKRNFYKLYFALMIQPSVWKKFNFSMNDIIEPLLKLMEDYYRKKGIKNPRLEAILVGALLDGIGFNFVYNPDLYPLEEVKKQVIERFV
ncbi:MAG: TetR/AcrR family transcriptional regulator [Bacteroidales bacterium]|nr:TetR/AcrR family transcriptional regulator [Bacteroidales bacterium]